MVIRCRAAVLFLVLVSACGSEPTTDVSGPAATTRGTAEPTTREPTDDTTPTPSPSRTQKPNKAGTRVVASDSEFGPMLFDSTGQAIYLFDVERTPTPRCYDDCAVAWPPVLTDGAPLAGKGVNGSLLATSKRTDGTVQVTYNGHPLYYYAHEGKHDVKCHDVFLNGGKWYVVQPDGDAAPAA